MTTTTEATGLIVLPSGEVIAQAAPNEELAQAVDTIGEMRAELTSAEELISGELLRRLDKRGSWTLRVGDPAGRCQWEIKAPSPTAGTTAYDTAHLATILEQLVEADLIDRELASEALERKVTVTFKLPTDQAVDELLASANADERVASTSASKSAVAGAIARVEKTSERAKAAVALARRTVSAPTRRAKVTRKEKR